MKILLLSKYSRKGASSRLRSFQYIPYLEAHGFSVTIENLFDDQHLSEIYTKKKRSKRRSAKLYLTRLLKLFRSNKYDLIWIEKEIFPYLPAFAERFLFLLNKPYVVDYDDAIFHNYDLSSNPVIRKLLSNNIKTIMRLSSHVIAGNDYLGSYAESAGARNITIIPSVVDHTRYKAKHDSRSSQPVIGWIGTPFTQKYIVGIKKALKTACDTFGARLMLVGANPRIKEELSGFDIEVVPWTEEQEGALINRMDIGIMPLADEPWERGKCGYKLIQYMACSVPVITSPVGVNVQIVQGSHSGLLASSIDEWEASLAQLLASREKRLQLGQAGRAAVENQYSMQIQAPRLAKIFDETIKGRT